MTEEKVLHIISFHEPYPPDYGGVIDVYYKLQALNEKGIKVILHTFTDKMIIDTKPLKEWVKEVHVYPRAKAWLQWIEGKPYSVFSRMNKELLQNLSKDNHPILFEGLQTTGVASQLNQPNRKIFLRMHNVEWMYYSELSRFEKNILKRAYMIRESFLLQQYEQQVFDKFKTLFCISINDEAYYAAKNPRAEVLHIPPFHGYNKVEVKSGKGDYVLYHGNLGIAENENIAQQLIRISNDFKIRLIIAGKNPTNYLQSMVKQYPNASIDANPEENKMQHLMQNAQIHIVAAAQGAGVKLKTIGALYTARWIITNENGIPDMECTHFCQIENDYNQYPKVVNSLINQEVTQEDIAQRKVYVERKFSNLTNVERIISTIF